MSLTPGTRLGSYEVISPAGAGGMGEVYRATDSALKRTVALKVMPAGMAGDADRLARFKREAEVLASLNHPSIAAIYGLASADGVNALVMEFVGVEASGLHASNVSTSKEDTPTVTSPAMTALGMILGTAAYLSPEQARGKPVDRRADVWALGCVLYEMLTGKRAFSGAEVTDVIAAVVTRDPDLSALPADTPSNVRAVLAGCFVKDPRQRLRDIGDVKLLLLEPSATSSPGPGIAPARRSKLIASLATGVGILATALIAMIAVPNSATDNSAPSRLAITFPDGAHLRPAARHRRPQHGRDAGTAHHLQLVHGAQGESQVRFARGRLRRCAGAR